MRPLADVNRMLERLTHKRSLTLIGGAYVVAALLVAGPWIFTVLGLIGLGVTACADGCDELALFRTIVIYSSMFSLIVTSPIAFLFARHISDQLFQGKRDGIVFALACAFTIFAFTIALAVVPFYGWGATLTSAQKLAAIHNVMLIGCSWLLIPFLGVTRAYRTVLAAFALGAIAMTLLGWAIPEPSALWLLVSFNAGFAVVNAILLISIIRTFGRTNNVDASLFQLLKHKWELPAAGACYALGLWVDKVIMWVMAPSGTMEMAGVLRTMPSYDTAMFWAHLSAIPIIAVFFVHIETQYKTLSEAFYGGFRRRASLRELAQAMGRIRIFVISNLVGMFAALIIVAATMIALSFVFMHELGLRPSYMTILRTALCAIVFHTSAMFCFIFLLYFDLRKSALLIVATYFALNGILTYSLLPMGAEYYGYGTMIAAALSFLLGFGLLLKELPWLHYHAVITNNTSIQQATGKKWTLAESFIGKNLVWLHPKEPMAGKRKFSG
ncbi:MAG: exopolysaccharide Pel transporter PelG [Hyphomicrobiaceae bacterium]|nr:exopolysaccharide Pel transporter PelG [Hyphomicrobiaceae bacterium]